jgi:hypothetical protein
MRHADLQSTPCAVTVKSIGEMKMMVYQKIVNRRVH